MPNVRFNLKNRNEKSTLISAVFRYDTKRLVYSTGQKINPKFWNDKEQKARETFKFLQYSEFNAYLKKVETETLNIYRRYKTDGKPLSVEQFKKELDIALEKVKKDEAPTLFEFIEDFIKTREYSLSKPKGSIQVYKKAYKHLRDFAAYAKRKIDFEHIDLTFLDEFLQFLYMPPRSLSTNYSLKIVQNLKLFLNEATERGYNKYHAYRNRKFTIKKEATDNIYLSITELKKIETLELSHNPRLEKVRDLFLIGCYTGLRFSDYSDLKKEHFKKIEDTEVIEIVTKKTKEKVVIPINPLVKAILEKYNGGTPTPISNQKMNQYLKELGEIAGINDTVIKVRTKGGKRIDETYPKYQLISTHTARRSFATNAYKAGVPVTSIKRLTGHSTDTAFMHYIKINNEENAILMAQNSFFK